MLPTVNQVLQQHYMPMGPSDYMVRENDVPAEVTLAHDPTDMLVSFRTVHRSAC